MGQISDQHLITILARASREFDRARGLLMGEDQPTSEQIEEEVEKSPDSGAGGPSPESSGDEATGDERSARTSHRR
ncbi:hypothetical protein ACQBAT_14665 [Ornithinimicrobium sp. Y1847]|uniref:hypothetical protein n=1 Tax=Ornithinimicrobium sp. Y1847 TaxID=3405419 RepID=UPI003B67BFA5